MRQLCGGLRFTPEPVVQVRRVRRRLHDLDRHLAVERQVARQVDGAHAAAAEKTQDAVLASELRFQRLAKRVAGGLRE
jgi:hypothetical protein